MDPESAQTAQQAIELEPVNATPIKAISTRAPCKTENHELPVLTIDEVSDDDD